MPLHALDVAMPRIDPTAWVAPSAELIGEVVLAAHASIWFGAVVRADNTPIRIGARSNVQDGAVLHSDPGAPLVLGEDCTVGHRVVLHGCAIGNRVLVGMGAIVMNGAAIGDDSIVGAGALVTEGKIFPPRSLIVGSPAKAVRTLDDAAVAGIARSADRYVRNAARHAAGLAPA